MIHLTLLLISLVLAPLTVFAGGQDRYTVQEGADIVGYNPNTGQAAIIGHESSCVLFDSQNCRNIPGIDQDICQGVVLPCPTAQGIAQGNMGTFGVSQGGQSPGNFSNPLDNRNWGVTQGSNGSSYVPSHPLNYVEGVFLQSGIQALFGGGVPVNDYSGLIREAHNSQQQAAYYDQQASDHAAASADLDQGIKKMLDYAAYQKSQVGQGTARLRQQAKTQVELKRISQAIEVIRSVNSEAALRLEVATSSWKNVSTLTPNQLVIVKGVWAYKRLIQGHDSTQGWGLVNLIYQSCSRYGEARCNAATLAYEVMEEGLVSLARSAEIATHPTLGNFASEIQSTNAAYRMAERLADLATQYLPGLSTGRDVYELFTGVDLITKLDLTITQRARKGN